MSGLKTAVYIILAIAFVVLLAWVLFNPLMGLADLV